MAIPEAEMNNPPEYLRNEVEAVNRAKEDAACSVINLGKRLCELKDACRHGEFMETAEGCCGLGIDQCQNLMRIYKSFGEKPSVFGFSTRALLELTRAPEPEVALAEATARKEAGEDITAKQAKEIARLHTELLKARIELRKRLSATNVASKENSEETECKGGCNGCNVPEKVTTKEAVQQVEKEVKKGVPVRTAAKKVAEKTGKSEETLRSAHQRAQKKPPPDPKPEPYWGTVVTGRYKTMYNELFYYIANQKKDGWPDESKAAVASSLETFMKFINS